MWIIHFEGWCLPTWFLDQIIKLSSNNDNYNYKIKLLASSSLMHMSWFILELFTIPKLLAFIIFKLTLKVYKSQLWGKYRYDQNSFDRILIISWGYLVTHTYQLSLGLLFNYSEKEIQLRKWERYSQPSERNTVDKIGKIQYFGKKLKFWNDDLKPRPPCHLHPSIEPCPTSHSGPRIYFQFPQNPSSK